MSKVQPLDRKQIFAALAVHAPMLKSQYYSLTVLLDEQKRKSSQDPWEQDIERLEKIRDTLRTTLAAIERALQLMVFACSHCSKCSPALDSLKDAARHCSCGIC